MNPRDTLYRLAHGQRDLRACQTMARAQGVSVTMSWPTVVADRHDQIIGCLGTRPSKKAVIAGPLVVAPTVQRPVLTVMRLIEAYEVVLKQAGVRFFFFKVDFGNEVWRRLVEKMGHRAYHQDGQGTIYRREVR